jgi:integrase/recombinase XerD
MAMPRPNEAATYNPWHATGYDPDADLDELFEEFIEESAVSHISANTETTYRTDYQRFRNWLVETGTPLTASALERRVLTRYITFLKQRPNLKPGPLRRTRLSEHSLNSYLRPIRTFIRYLVADHRFPNDTLWGARSPMPRPGPRLSKAPSRDQVACLDRGTQGNEPLRLRDRVLFLIALDDGPRPGEIVNLPIGAVSLDGAYVEIHGAKGDKSRVFPISRETVVTIRRYLRRARPVLTGVAATDVSEDARLIVAANGSPLTTNGAYQAISRAFQRGGGSGHMGLYRYRHLFASHTQNAGGDSRAIQDILGHSDPKTTRGYAGQTSLERRRAVHAEVTPLATYLKKGRRRFAADRLPD